jgi:hypothetical protein
MMSKRIKSIAEFKPKVEEYTITNPENGDEFVIAMRPLTNKQISELGATLKRPKAKVSGFSGKDHFGNPIPIYDEEDPEYVRALSKYNREFAYVWFLACAEIEVPGETPEDKIAYLEDNVPNWVFNEIQRKLQEIQGFRTSDVAYAKKKSRNPQIGT